ARRAAVSPSAAARHEPQAAARLLGDGGARALSQREGAGAVDRGAPRLALGAGAGIANHAWFASGRNTTKEPREAPAGPAPRRQGSTSGCHGSGLRTTLTR